MICKWPPLCKMTFITSWQHFIKKVKDSATLSGSVMVWTAISWYSQIPTVTAKNYRTVPEDCVQWMSQTLYLEGGGVFQHDNTHSVLMNTKVKLNILHALHTHHVWGILEERVRKRFPPPAWHGDPDTVLEEERLRIPLDAVKDCICHSQDELMLYWPQNEAVQHIDMIVV